MVYYPDGQAVVNHAFFDNPASMAEFDFSFLTADPQHHNVLDYLSVNESNASAVYPINLGVKLGNLPVTYYVWRVNLSDQGPHFFNFQNKPIFSAKNQALAFTLGNAGVGALDLSYRNRSMAYYPDGQSVVNFVKDDDAASGAAAQLVITPDADRHAVLDWFTVYISGGTPDVDAVVSVGSTAVWKVHLAGVGPHFFQFDDKPIFGGKGVALTIDVGGTTSEDTEIYARYR